MPRTGAVDNLAGIWSPGRGGIEPVLKSELANILQKLGFVLGSDEGSTADHHGNSKTNGPNHGVSMDENQREENAEFRKSPTIARQGGGRSESGGSELARSNLTDDSLEVP